MLKPKDFKGRAKRLEDLDIPRIGSVIGVGEDEVHAFMEVEAANSGFDRQGRPKMLFEPHVFYRNLSGAERNRAEAAGVAYRGWKSGAYPSDSYPKMEIAYAINPEAALKSASWGRTQVLGENHKIVGYATAHEMVQAFMDDEENHLEALIEFVIANNIDDDLRRLAALDRATVPSDCETIVRVYNGPGYREHNYHGRLAKAHNRWRRIDDTAWNPDGQDILYPELKIGHFGFVVEHLQETLSEKGYPVGAIDQDFGTGTRAAVLAFQADNGLATTGVVDQKTWAALEHFSSEAPLIETRKETTVADLRNRGSRTIKTADAAQVGGVVTAFGGIIGTLAGGDPSAVEAALETGEQVTGLLDRAQGVLGPFTTFLEDNWQITLASLGAVVIWQAWRAKELRLEDHKTGKHRGR